MEMRELARLGARTRLAQLAAEIDSIQRSFPELRATKKRGRPPILESQADQRASVGTRKRKPMSAAAKKAVGERMRRYWAARRKAAAEVANNGAAESASVKTQEKLVKPTRKRSKLSAAGRAAISAAQKKRWALRKRAGKKR
jgi:hypothetical protein